MRPDAGFEVSGVVPVAGVVGQTVLHSGWHSPVTYLFGGLAAMLGLIAFALLILACSYWKLSGYLESVRPDGGDHEDGHEGKPGGEAVKMHVCFEEGIVVIMAGDEKPTFLAMPMSSRASSFGDRHSRKNGKVSEEKEEKMEGSVSIAVVEAQSESQEGNQEY